MNDNEKDRRPRATRVSGKTVFAALAVPLTPGGIGRDMANIWTVSIGNGSRSLTGRGRNGIVLVGSCVSLRGAECRLTVANYHHVFLIGWEYIKDTLFLSTVATPITGVLAMIIAFLVVRKKFFGRRALELTSMLTFAAPGTVVGIGYILAFNQPPLILTGTAAIIVLLFIFRNMPTGIQAGIAALQQIDPSIEEASCDQGASRGSRVGVNLRTKSVHLLPAAPS
jgi:ABC-type glycerol-3-phosphate transport system permease component